MRLTYLALPFLLLATSARAGDAIDTRITFSLADDDVLTSAVDSSAGSPTLPNFVPTSKNRLFFDDYERRDTGLENLTHLVVYGHQPGFFEGLDTEAALVVRLDYVTEQGLKKNNEGLTLSDDGSYVRLAKSIADGKVSLTGFPISAHRFALGYSYDISWGGKGIFKTQLSPGMKLQWDTEGAYAFLGFKATQGSRQILSDNTRDIDTVYGVLGGGGIDLVDELRIEAGAGFFKRGQIDKNELIVLDGTEYEVAPWQAFGVSAQVLYHVGIPVGIPIDFRLYRNDPLKREDFFKPEIYDGGTSFVVGVEASALGQTLQDPDRPTSSVVQPAIAGDFSARVKTGYWRFGFLAVYRDLAFLLFNVPSSPSFVDFPSGITPVPEYFASVSIDHYFEDLHLTPGLVLGVQRPAHTTTSVAAGNNAAESLQEQTVLFRSETELPQIMNPGDEVALIFASKLTARWDLSDLLSAVGELQYSYDKNRRRLADDPSGIAVWAPADPSILGFNMMLQARF